jgi:hypothetical protein
MFITNYLNSIIMPLSVILSLLEGISKEQIDIRQHALKRDTVNKEWIYNCILNYKPRGILEQRLNRFRIYYNHPTKRDRYDLIIVVDVENSTKTIIIVTTYEQLVERRVR